MIAPEGKIFWGWSWHGNIYAEGASATIDDSGTFTAIWAGRISATFDPGEGSGTPPDPITADEYGRSFTIPSLPGQGDMTAPEGKNFQGWRDLSSPYSSVLEADASVTISSDTTFTAQWTDKTMYTVGFSLEGVVSETPLETLKSMTVEAGTVITLPTVEAPEDKIFRYWGEQHGYGSEAWYTPYAAGASFTVSGNIILRAQWYNKYGITFALGGGGGTPPERIYVENSSDSITLPDQGDMTAPNGKYFRGWYRGTNYTGSGTVLMVGASVTSFTSANTTFTAVWNDYRVVAFDLGAVSGTPPESMTVKSGTTITLPEPGVTAPEGKVFQGWRYSSNSTVYQVGASVTITENRTFTAQWADKKYAREGIYVSLISFAGDAAILGSSGDFVFLDDAGKNTLSSILTSSYRRATESSTALFYGVHKGLENLKKNEGEFPTDISSVNLITFTDGLDNASYLASINNPIEGQRSVADYAAYVHDQIGSREINGKSITAYSVGVKGSDVEDDDLFTASLGNIASSSGNVKEITNFDDLGSTFTEIAESLTFANHFSMTTPGNNPGTVVRMTFDVTGTSSTDAAASSKYLEGTLAYVDEIPTLTNITYGSGITSDAGSGTTVIGTRSGSNVTFLFRNIKGYDTAHDTVRQWYKPSAGSSTWLRNSEYSAAGSTSTSTVFIQLVLDASLSLEVNQITQIQTAVDNFITTLYNRVTGGSN
jgi:hypothetical protein